MIKKKKKFPVTYLQYYASAAKLKEIIKDDVFFLPNGSCIIYFADYKNMFYGYEAHIDRFINLHHHLNISSSLLLASPKNADDSFKNGFVKYIITDNNTAAADHVQHYYPDYKYLTQTGLFSVYKYNL